MPSRVLKLLLAAGAISVIVAVGAGAGHRAPSTVTVHRIVDGDTLVVRGGARVRLVQLDAPESGEECYARASTLELTRLARRGSRVVLEADPLLDRVDRFGRLLRYVHSDGRNVNLELVRRGAATPWFYGGDRGRYARELLAAVASAKVQRRGMWGACRVRWSPEEPVFTR